MPGEARLATSDRKLSTKSRIIIAAVCQPLAINPPNAALRRGFRVDMHVLRVEAPRELDDLGLASPVISPYS